LVLRVPLLILRLDEEGALPRGVVEATDRAALRLGVDGVRVTRVLLRHEAVATADREPHRVGDRTLPASARSTPRAVVLEPAADAIRNLEIIAQVVELSDRKGVREDVRAALIERDRDAAVVADDHPLRIHGVDPHRVMIDVNALRR